MRYLGIQPLLLAGLALLLFELGGCAQHTPGISRLPTTSAQKSPAQAKVLDTAQQMLGVPYRSGGSSPRGFDCSGLASYSYKRAGIHIPRTTAQQYTQSQKITRRDLQPGDLVFFNLKGRKISHVGIYLNRGRFIHAPSSGKSVSIDSLENPYWHSRYRGAGRYF
jgi:cell wall-associated NlpC family hydrolase